MRCLHGLHGPGWPVLFAGADLGPIEAAAKETSRATTEFFLAPVVTEFVRLVVGQLLPLTEQEMETWAEEPERFLQEVQDEDWEGDLKPCADMLLATLLDRRADVSVPIVVELVAKVLDAPLKPGSAAGVAAAGSLPASAAELAAEMKMHPALLQESVLRAAGGSAYHIAEHLEFGEWYSARLLPLLTAAQQADQGATGSTPAATQQPEERVLRRRTVWLLGQWCSAGEFPRATRPSLYAALIPLLADADLAMALTAAQTLCELINDFGFVAAEFAEFTTPVLERVLSLLQRTTQGPSKLTAMTVLSQLIERVGDRDVHTFAPQISQCLPAVWASASAPGDDDSCSSMVKSGVVTAANHLTLALGSDASALFAFTVPMIRHCIDISQGMDHIYLLEDGMQLWGSTLQNARSLSPSADDESGLSDLMALYAYMSPIAERDFDNLLECLKISSSYMLLGRDSFMAVHAKDVVGILTGCVGQVKEHGLVAMAETAVLLLQIFPEQGPALLAPELLGQMLVTLVGADQQQGATTAEGGGAAASAVTAAYTLVVGRVICLDAGLFWEVLGQLALGPLGLEDPAPALAALLDMWLQHLTPAAIGGVAPACRKVRAVAAMALLSPPAAMGEGARSVAAERHAGVGAACAATAAGLAAVPHSPSQPGGEHDADDTAAVRQCEAERRRRTTALDAIHAIQFLQ